MSTTWTTEIKPGSGWTYDDAFLTYDGLIDPQTNLTVYYDAVGQLTAWTTIAKP